MNQEQNDREELVPSLNTLAEHRSNHLSARDATTRAMPRTPRRRARRRPRGLGRLAIALAIAAASTVALLASRWDSAATTTTPLLPLAHAASFVVEVMHRVAPPSATTGATLDWAVVGDGEGAASNVTDAVVLGKGSAVTLHSSMTGVNGVGQPTALRFLSTSDDGWSPGASYMTYTDDHGNVQSFYAPNVPVQWLDSPGGGLDVFIGECRWRRRVSHLRRNDTSAPRHHCGDGDC